MEVAIIIPADTAAHQGNRISAVRYAEILASLGQRARIGSSWASGDEDLLVALNAWKSAASIQRFAARWPARPLVVVLTGTDLYGAGSQDPAVARSLALASRIVVLQAAALRELDPAVRARSRVILQSARVLDSAPEPSAGSFDAVQLAHFRDVKDPLLGARALRRLPESSRLHLYHAGAALTPEWEQRAREEMQRNPRYAWLGDLEHAQAQLWLARARVFVQTSRSEGGSGALNEAAARGMAILATRIPAAEAVLGSDHPGLFPSEDDAALAACLLRCEREPAFLASLEARSRAVAPELSFECEREAWSALLDELRG